MASPVHFCLAVVLLSGFVHVDAYLQKYISLVSNVRKHYQTSSVFFVYSRNDRYLEEHSLAHTLCRDFSRKYIFTLIVNFEELKERTNWYHEEIGRPLVVIFLRSLSDVVKFRDNTQTINMSYPIWLVIFTNEQGEAFCEYCNYPKENSFGLRFDTEMLVVCCDNPILKEWWALNEKRTEMSDLATWTTDKPLIFLNRNGLYVRRHDVKGTGIRVGIVTNSVLAHEDGDTITGLFGDILRELQLAMNFTITETIRNPGFGTWSVRDKNWTGIIGELTRGRIDIGVADFTITKSRLEVVDFSFPLVVSRSRLYIKDTEKSGVQWSSYFQAFTIKVWTAISLTIILAPILLTVIKNRVGINLVLFVIVENCLRLGNLLSKILPTIYAASNAFTIKVWTAIILIIILAPILLTVIKIRVGTKSVLSLIAENYVYVWGIFCQQGLYEIPVSIPLRIAYLSIFVSALVVYAAYAASLVSFFTISPSGLPFSSLGGFVRDGSYNVIVYQNQSEYDMLANAKDPVMKKMRALLKPLKDLPAASEAGWDQVCKQKVGLYTNDIAKQMSNVNSKCKVVGIDVGYADNLAMIMPAGSQYTKIINYHIRRFEDMGILGHIRNNYYKKNNSEGPNFAVANLGGVIPILATLTGGIILALIALVCENMYYSLANGIRGRTHWENSRKVTRVRFKN